jgi:hypothetical protein
LIQRSWQQGGAESLFAQLSVQMLGGSSVALVVASTTTGFVHAPFTTGSLLDVTCCARWRGCSGATADARLQPPSTTIDFRSAAAALMAGSRFQGPKALPVAGLPLGLETSSAHFGWNLYPRATRTPPTCLEPTTSRQ